MLRRTALLAGTVLALAAAGCATAQNGDADMPGVSGVSSPSGAGEPGAPASQPTSGADLPTLKPPSGPPKTPTDNLPTDILVGIVTAGGEGPCYGMETNDGVTYALYGGDGVKLARGDTVRVKVEPLKLKIYCGPGQHRAIISLEIVR